MTHPDKQALQLANRIGTDVTSGLSYEAILSRNPRAIYELAKAVIAQAAELERVREAARLLFEEEHWICHADGEIRGEFQSVLDNLRAALKKAE